MQRREFSKLVVGAAGLGGLMTLTGPGARRVAAMTKTRGQESVDRAHRTEWAKEHFRGFENVLVASFTPDLQDLDEAGIRHDVRTSIRHGFFSTLVAPASLSNEELQQVMEIALDEANGEISVSFALHEGPEDQMLKQIEEAERAGCQHILLDTPKQGSQDELYDYVAKWSERTNMGIYLWMAQVHGFNRFHSSGIPYSFFDRAADLPNVIALKVGAMDPAVMYELFERYNDRMLIGALWPNIMPIGIRKYGQQWSGAWTVEALQSPETPYAVDFFRLMMAGHCEEGMKLYWDHVAPGFGAMMKLMGRHMASGAHPWELIKFYQFVVGGNGGQVRVDPEHPDIPPVSPEDMAFVRGIYEKLGVQTSDLPSEAFPIGRVNWRK